MKKVLAALIILASIAGLTFGWYVYQDSHQPEESIRNVEKLKPSYELNLLAVGDVMLARKVERLIQANGEEYPFKNVKGRLEAADLTIGNLESPLSSRGKALPGKGIAFRARPEMARVVSQTGFDVMSLANNHSLDYDTDAFLDTIDLLKFNGVRTIGGGRNIMEAREPVIVERNGLKIGFLAYTIFADIYYDARYRRAFEATDAMSGVAPLVKDQMIEDIAKLDPTVDYTVVSLHWGTEYARTPDESQKILARALIDSGADLIVGHHPHIIQGFERYKNGLIAYSLGNFVFDQNWSDYTRKGLMLNVKFTRKGMEDVNAVPVFIHESQPAVMTGTEADKLLNDLKSRTQNLGTSASIRGNSLQL